MSVAIVVPKLGDIMESAVVARWLKEEGDWVAIGDALFDIESDKVSFTVEAVQTGHLHRLVSEGSELAVGDVAGLLLSPDEAAAARRRSDGSS
jgi:pyruvate/2-oxoglutarate dehydrogenase complex dihydrolipoamide acyltransferase (E2) component